MFCQNKFMLHDNNVKKFYRYRENFSFFDASVRLNKEEIKHKEA